MHSSLQNKRGFTLVEIMVVVAIIAILAGIAIPNLLRAKITANDAMAKATLKSLSTASETFTTFNNGNYPGDITSLTGASPAYINKPYCGTTASGYTFNCTMSSTTYNIAAVPISIGQSGTTTYTIVTGGVLTP